MSQSQPEQKPAARWKILLCSLFVGAIASAELVYSSHAPSRWIALFVFAAGVAVPSAFLSTRLRKLGPELRVALATACVLFVHDVSGDIWLSGKSLVSSVPAALLWAAIRVAILMAVSQMSKDFRAVIKGRRAT